MGFLNNGTCPCYWINIEHSNNTVHAFLTNESKVGYLPRQLIYIHVTFLIIAVIQCLYTWIPYAILIALKYVPTKIPT